VGVALVIAEPTGTYRRDLRRFTWGASDGRICSELEQEQPPWRGHDATVTIAHVTEAEADPVHGDNWPRDDGRWPQRCRHCGYRFVDSDQWQRNDCAIYRLPDGTEFAKWGVFGRIAPPGTMIRADWFDQYSQHPEHIESWMISLPDGGEWTTSQRAGGGGYWTVTGTPPKITVTPSIWHNQSGNGWHGFVTNGELVSV
jgi:hypothetical protein